MHKVSARQHTVRESHASQALAIPGIAHLSCECYEQISKAMRRGVTGRMTPPDFLCWTCQLVHHLEVWESPIQLTTLDQ